MHFTRWSAAKCSVPLSKSPKSLRAWRAADVAADTRWKQSWSKDELGALFAWAGSITAEELQADPVIASRLALDPPAAIAERAASVRNELIDGCGMTLISGIDVDAYDHAQIAVAFVLFGATIGSLRSQNAAGDLLGHVIDIGADATDPATRIYQTNQRQTFHTDSTDAVGLLCLRTASQGGASMVVNVEAVYDQMKAQAPRLAERLFEPVATDRRGEQPAGEEPWFEIPVLSRTGARITGLYQRQYIDSASRFDEAPKPDAEYVEALDLFDQILNDPELFVQMEFSPGDIQLVHNHSLLHDRTGFIDPPDPAQRRHLLRLWMSLPGDRELPDVFAQRYGQTTVGNRGGIVVDGAVPRIALAAPAAHSSR